MSGYMVGNVLRSAMGRDSRDQHTDILPVEESRTACRGLRFHLARSLKVGSVAVSSLEGSDRQYPHGTSLQQCLQSFEQARMSGSSLRVSERTSVPIESRDRPCSGLRWSTREGVTKTLGEGQGCGGGQIEIKGPHEGVSYLSPLSPVSSHGPSRSEVFNFLRSQRSKRCCLNPWESGTVRYLTSTEERSILSPRCSPRIWAASLRSASWGLLIFSRRAIAASNEVVVIFSPYKSDFDHRGTQHWARTRIIEAVCCLKMHPRRTASTYKKIAKDAGRQPAKADSDWLVPFSPAAPAPSRIA